MRVEYGNEFEAFANWTSIYIDGPQGPNGKNGVAKTGKDLNLGYPYARTVQGSWSYQLYSDSDDQPSLAMGVDVRARIEAIGVKELKRSEMIKGCYLSYGNAALLELCRRDHEDCNKPQLRNSLKGHCCWPENHEEQDELVNMMHGIQI